MGPPMVPSPMNPTRSVIHALPSVRARPAHGTAAARALTTPSAASTISAMDLLARLLRGRPDVIDVGDDIVAWWRRFCAEETASAPFDRAVLAGFRANRVAGAFA